MFPYIYLFGEIKIPLYGTLFMMGFLAAILVARKLGPKFGLPKEDVLYGAVYAAIGILVGAKLLFCVTKISWLIDRWDMLGRLMEKNALGTLMYVHGQLWGGFVFYGGLLGAVLGVYLYCRQYKVPFVPYMDVFAPLIPFIHGVGRIGCFCAGCCFGIEYHGFGSVQFPENPLIKELAAVPRFPVQLLEAALNFIVCAVLFLIMKKKKPKPGVLMGIYLLYYTVVRFLLEMLRGDVARGKIGVISTSQIISMVLLPVGILLVRGKWIEKKTNKNSDENQVEFPCE